MNLIKNLIMEVNIVNSSSLTHPLHLDANSQHHNLKDSVTLTPDMTSQHSE